MYLELSCPKLITSNSFEDRQEFFDSKNSKTFQEIIGINKIDEEHI